MGGTPSETAAVTKRDEVRAFVFLAFALIPLLAVLFVAGYGFAVWIWQIFTGPPGPPSP